MQKFIVFLSVIIIVAMLALQHFSPIYELPTIDDYSENIDVENDDMVSISKILDDIYFNISTIGIKDATEESLADDFYIDSSDYLSVWGKYTDGNYGIDDLIIMRPLSGKENKTIEALTNIKLARINHFRNYDIYNAYNIAVNGEIFQLGDYYILMMMNDPQAARQILEKSILVG